MKAFARCLILLSTGFLGTIASARADTLTLFDEGSSTLNICLHKQASQELIASAQDLSETLFLMSGTRIPVIEENCASPKGIHLERGTPSTTPEDLESFKIWTDQDGLHLSGQSDIAISHAIYTFLQEHGGCRWYTPGEEGAYIPQKTTWILGPLNETHEPHFLSREFFGLNTDEEKLWAKRNRLNKRFEYHHNLFTIFNEDVFKEHPEWFALINGKRTPPRDNERTAQPNFSSIEAADYAAHTASEYFLKNPDVLSFSLGMNDGLAIDTSEATRALIEPIQFFRDTPDFSDLIFRFMNRASETLQTTFPQKYLGCLAYHYALNVPSFPVSPKVIPYITADRSQWYDKRCKEDDLELIRRWSQAGPEITGIYDYYYGHPFAIPRIFTRYIHESLQFAYDNGIRGFTAEIYPIWPIDGPKAWLAAQLLWDTSRNRVELLDDFYRNYFQSSAKLMERFYSLCEEAWIRQETPGWWLKYYKNPEQTDIFSKSTLRTLEDLLSIAHKEATDQESKKKVEQTIDAFRITLALAKINQTTENLEQLKTGSSAAILTQAIQDYYVARESLEKNVSDIESWAFLSERNPIPSTLSRFYESNELNNSNLENLIQAQGSRADLTALHFLRGKSKIKKENVLQNTGFSSSDWYGLEIPEWEQSSWITPEGFILAHQESTSDRGVLIKNQRSLSLTQTIPIKPGAWYVFSTKTRGTRSSAGSTSAFIRWQDHQGETLGKSKQATLPQNQLEAYPLTSIGKAPGDAVFASFTLRVSHQTEDEWTQFDQATATEIAL